MRDEIIKGVDDSVANLKMDEDFVSDIMKQNGYRSATTISFLRKIIDIDYLSAKFSCHDDAEVLNDVPQEWCHIVTGFGPTNSPTCGTLSVILRAISLQKQLGIDTSVIISNLGAWNSRNIGYPEMKRYTQKFLEFIPQLGFDTRTGDIRTHEDFDNLVVSGTIGKVLRANDFNENQEVTRDMYRALSIQGSDYGTMLDANYTVADILKPAFVLGKKRILVLAGIEEHYFTRLAKVVVMRLSDLWPNGFLPEDLRIGGLYARLIKGLHPYPKMSKSIPQSSINIGDSEAMIEQKICHSSPHDDEVLLQMMNLVSDWSLEELRRARLAYETRREDTRAWQDQKEKYLTFFLRVKKIWDSAADGGGIVRFQGNERTK